MAWWTIHYSCGHEGRESLCGPIKDRNRWAQKLGHKLCPDCYRLQHAADAPNISLRRIPGDSPQKIELIATGNTYPHREEFRARGWRFGRFNRASMWEVIAWCKFAPNLAMRALNGSAGWSIVCDATQFDREMVWLGSVKGWSVMERPADSRTVTLLASAVIEGRRDLIP